MVNILDVDNISFEYSGRIVIEDIGFHAEPGEIIGILGPNGCGKTTLLKILNRNLKAKTGTVCIEGDEINDISKKDIAQRMAVVPQNNEISFSFTVTDIVMMGRMPNLDRFEMESEDDLRIVFDAMEKCNVLQFADRFINHLSGGERQRAIIARALAQEPRVLLMDEPTLHLDVNHQIDMLDMVRSLAKEKGLTVVIVSHDLSLAARYCDRLFLISEHHIIASGKVKDVLTPENMRRVFSIEAYLEDNERVGGPVVQIISSVKG
ncbi:MAG: ABC transporter ATP-binding protein [Candidatus Methanomethylophilaceae archaeon]|nr:ABC transporter ATP-binding protein [Candidatus Methanomethylophilaceae archaeon]